MIIKNIDVDLIKPYEKNAKVHTEEQITAVGNSIEKFGFKQPIVVNKDYVIIIGHCRYLAAKKIGLQEVPCVVCDNLTPQQENALRLIDNRTNESGWITTKLTDELKELNNIIDMTELGFSIADIIYYNEDFEPDNLDFDGEDLYIANANNVLKARQITISYKDEEEEKWLANKLGTDKLKVVYYAKKLKEE